MPDETTALAVRMSTSDLREFALASCHSTLLERKFNTKDPKTIAHNTVLLCQTAQDLHLPPVASLQHIHVIENGIMLGAHLIMGIIARAKAGQIEITEGPDFCEMTGHRDGGVVEECTVRYTTDDAKKAGLLGKKNWQANLRDMLYARCLGRLSRRMWPDLLLGMYVQGEMPGTDAGDTSTVTISDGDFIDVDAVAVEDSDDPDVPAPTGEALMERCRLLNGTSVAEKAKATFKGLVPPGLTWKDLPSWPSKARLILDSALVELEAEVASCQPTPQQEERMLYVKAVQDRVSVALAGENGATVRENLALIARREGRDDITKWSNKGIGELESVLDEDEKLRNQTAETVEPESAIANVLTDSQIEELATD